MAEIIKPQPKKPNVGFIQKFLRRRVGKEPLEVPADIVKNLIDPKAKLDFHRRLLTTGSTFDASRLAKMLSDALTTSYWRRSFYRECFTGDTKIALLDGRDVDIKTLAEEHAAGKVNYVYSIDMQGKKIQRCKIENVWKQPEQRQIVKVLLDNEEEIRCTPEHPFMLRDGTYREAKNLRAGDSLMPLYRKEAGDWYKGYWKVYDPFKQKTAGMLNHKVVGIETTNQYEEVYDIQVGPYNNFALSVGVFVHNCELCSSSPIVSSALNVYCLTGDTKVPLLDGRTLTIEEVIKELNSGKEMWVYSCDFKGSPAPEKIMASQNAGYKETVRIWLDNGEYVDASSDHRFILRDGSLKEAGRLQVGESLMPFHRMQQAYKKSYELVWDVAKKNWQSTYKMVAAGYFGVDTSKTNKFIPDQEDRIVIHHMDYNKNNNDPHNLKLMTKSQHNILHRRTETPETRAKRKDSLHRYFYERGGCERRAQEMKERWADLAWKENRVKQIQETAQRPEVLEKLMKRVDALAGQKRNKTYEEIYGSEKASQIKNRLHMFGAKIHTETHERRMCPQCGISFEESKLSKQTCCSTECANKQKVGRFKVAREIRTCICGVKFECLVTSSRRWCSTACGARNATPRGPRVARIKKGCIWCGQSFEVLPRHHRRKFCSMQCAAKFNSARKPRNELGCFSVTVPSYNHKVVKVEHKGSQMVYDISVSGSHLFGLASGIYVHNTDAITATSPQTNRIIWPSAKDPKTENALWQFTDNIGQDERIRDWAGQLAQFGDYFIEAIGMDGIGIAYVDDNLHPADLERIDINGRLEGFVRTGLYTERSAFTADLEAPWRYVHMRIFGLSKKTLNTALGIFGEPSRMYSLERDRMGERKFRVTTRYGTSLLLDAIPIYKRVKMAEDSIMLARQTRGIMWYLYKIKVIGGNMDTAVSLVQEYAEYLKRNTAYGLNTDDAQKEWRDRFMPILGQVEDLFVPISDDVDVTVDKMGGEPDIRAIVDVERLDKQLLMALRVSPMLLGMTDDLPGALGEGSANRVSINFARNAQRLGQGIKSGIKRMWQIHLAYLNMNPDPTLFDVNSAEISSAEEEELKNALKSGTEVVSALMEIISDAVPNIDKLDVLEYLNLKILKLNDFNFEALRTKLAAKGVAGLGVIPNEAENESMKNRIDMMVKREIRPIIETDCATYLPAILANGEQQAREKLIAESLGAMATVPDENLDEGQRALKYKLTNTRKSFLFQAVRMVESKDKEPKKYEAVKESVTWEPQKINFKAIPK